MEENQDPPDVKAQIAIIWVDYTEVSLGYTSKGYFDDQSFKRQVQVKVQKYILWQHKVKGWGKNHWKSSIIWNTGLKKNPTGYFGSKRLQEICNFLQFGQKYLIDCEKVLAMCWNFEKMKIKRHLAVSQYHILYHLFQADPFNISSGDVLLCYSFFVCPPPLEGTHVWKKNVQGFPDPFSNYLAWNSTFFYGEGGTRGKMEWPIWVLQLKYYCNSYCTTYFRFEDSIKRLFSTDQIII